MNVKVAATLGALALVGAVAAFFLIEGGDKFGPKTEGGQSQSTRAAGTAQKKTVKAKAKPRKAQKVLVAKPKLELPARLHKDWKVTRRFLHASGSVNAVASSKDGRLIATGGEDRQVILWDTKTRKIIRVLHGHQDGIEALAFSPDGRWLASTDGGTKVRLWEVATGKRRLLAGHTSNTAPLSFSPDGRLLASASNNGTVRLWSTASGEQLKVLTGEDKSISEVAFSPDGKLLLVRLSSEKELLIWDVASGQIKHRLKGHEREIRVATFSPDSHLVATGSKDGTVRLWDAQSGKMLHVLKAHREGAVSVVFSPAGNLLASGSGLGEIMLWDAKSGSKVRTLEAHRSGMRLAFSKGGATLVSGSSDGSIKWWNAATGEALKTYKGSRSFVRLLVSPDSDMLIAHEYSAGVRLLDMKTGKSIGQLDGHSLRVSSIALSPDRRRLVTGGGDGSAHVFDLTSGKRLFILKGHIGRVRQVGFSNDGRAIFTLSIKGKAVRVWSAESGQLQRKMGTGDPAIASFAISADGRRLVTGNDGDTITLWALDTGKQLKSFKAPNNYLTGPQVKFGARGLLIYAGYGDGTLRLWDIASGKTTVTKKISRYEISSLSLSPTNQSVAVGTIGGDIAVIDIADGTVRKINRDKRWVNFVAFTPDGKSLITGVRQGRTYSGTLQIWNIRARWTSGEIKLGSWPRDVILLPDTSRMLIAADHAGAILITRRDRAAPKKQTTPKK